MARTSVDITNDEGRAYQAWCPKRNVIANDDGNLLFIHDYFVNQWREMITDQNLETAYTTGTGFKDRLRHYVDGQLEFGKLYAALSKEEQDAFNQPGWGQGLKEGSYKSGVALISWLKGHKFKVTKENLQLAMGQNNVLPHLEFDESQKPQSTLNRHKRHGDDGKKFLTEGMVPDGHGGLRSMTPQEQKAAREAAEAAKKPVQQSPSTPDAWSQMVSQLLQFGTARQQKEIKVVHDYCLAQKFSPRRTYEKVSKLVDGFKRETDNYRSIH